MGILGIFTANPNKKKKSHLKNLLAVGLADGSLDQIELEYLMELASALDMPPREIDEIMQYPSRIQFKAPSSFEEKVGQLYELVRMMVVNGEIHEKELKVCQALALKLNILPKMVDDLIHMILQKLASGKSQDEIIQEMSVMHMG